MANKFYKILEQMHVQMQNISRKKEILTVEETAEYLGFATSYLYKLTAQRIIPHYKPLNKKIFFKRSEIDQWIMAHPVETMEKSLERAMIPLKRKI